MVRVTCGQKLGNCCLTGRTKATKLSLRATPVILRKNHFQDGGAFGEFLLDVVRNCHFDGRLVAHSDYVLVRRHWW